VSHEAIDAVLVEHEFRDGSHHVGIAHQCEPAIVQNQPLSIDPRCGHRVVFVRKKGSYDRDLDVPVGKSGRSQGDILNDRIVFAVAAMRLQGFQRRTPMVCDPPLGFIGGWTDRQLHGPVD
jgi:hypothetical protein